MDLRKEFLEQQQLVLDHLSPFVDQLLQAAAPFEVWVTSWCIENYVPLAQLKNGDVHFVFYERLKLDPIAELTKIFTFLGHGFDKAALKQFSVLSATSRSKRPFNTRTDSIEGWREYTAENDAASTRRILRLFGLDGIYGDRSIPDAGKADELLLAQR